MPEPQPERYTLSIEDLLDIFLDGMLSGVVSALINEMYGPEAIEEVREGSLQHMHMLIEDPAFTETIRDTIRARMRGEINKRTLLRIKGFDNG